MEPNRLNTTGNTTEKQIIIIFITILSSENSSPLCLFLDGCYCTYRVMVRVGSSENELSSGSRTRVSETGKQPWSSIPWVTNHFPWFLICCGRYCCFCCYRCHVKGAVMMLWVCHHSKGAVVIVRELSS